MPDITSDGKTRVAWVTSIANINAPTTTELTAGILLQGTMTADGLMNMKPTTADVNTNSLASVFDTNVNGRVSFSNPTLKFKRQSPVGTDTIFNTLVRDTAGFLVIRRSVTESTVWTSGQPIEVYPALCEEIARTDVAPNSVETYEVGLKITASPSLRAAIA